MAFNGTDSTWTSTDSTSNRSAEGNQNGNFLSKTFKSIGNKAKKVGKAVSSSARKFDEKTNFTGKVAGLATGVAATRLVQGQGKDSAKALSVAGASLVVKEQFSQQRERENERSR